MSAVQWHRNESNDVLALCSQPAVQTYIVVQAIRGFRSEMADVCKRDEMGTALTPGRSGNRCSRRVRVCVCVL